MNRRTCSCCKRSLPAEAFPPPQRRRTECLLCEADIQRARARLAPVRVDPQQVRLNNHFNLWFGPVRREPLRNAA